MQSAVALMLATTALLFAGSVDTPASPSAKPAPRIAAVSVQASGLPDASSFKPGVFDTPAHDVTKAGAAGEGQSRPFRRDVDGHFYVTANVNGTPIRFLVDTGATIVVLRKADAERAGLHLRAADYHQSASTAGGDVAIAPVRLNSMAVDNVAVNNVEAAVDQGELDVSLLGQSYLNRIQGLNIDGDRLTLRSSSVRKAA